MNTISENSSNQPDVITGSDQRPVGEPEPVSAVEKPDERTQRPYGTDPAFGGAARGSANGEVPKDERPFTADVTDPDAESAHVPVDGDSRYHTFQEG